MDKEQQLKYLLKECVNTIDQWNLVNAAQPVEDFRKMVQLLIASSYEAGINPNQLDSLKPLLKEGKFQIIKK